MDREKDDHKHLGCKKASLLQKGMRIQIHHTDRTMGCVCGWLVVFNCLILTDTRKNEVQNYS